MRGQRLLTVLLALALVLSGAASASAAIYLTKNEARHQAKLRVKKEMRRGGGDYYEINGCYRYSRRTVGCEYYYEWYDDAGRDEYCSGRMMVTEDSGDT